MTLKAFSFDPFLSSFPSEQEMERKIQEHTQELERLKQDSVIVKDKLIHEASLKKRAAEVSLNQRHCFNIELEEVPPKIL